MVGVLAIILALAGLGLVGRAIVMARRRGHPRCARCGYDVGGQAPGDPPRERCSECGADLRGLASIVTGRGRLRIGVSLVVLAAVVVIAVAVSHVDRRQRDVWRHIPASVLVWTARAESTKVGERALREVERRLVRDEMSGRGVRKVLRIVLPRGKDDAAWRYRPAWDTAARWALARGDVPVEDLVESQRRLFERTLRLTILAPGEAGGIVPYTVNSKQRVSVRSVRLGDREVREIAGYIEIPMDTPPGTYELTLIVGRKALVKLAGPSRFDPPYAVSADLTVELRGTVVIE